MYFYLNYLIKQNGIKGILFREWAPNADSLSLVGDFNNWDTSMNPCKKNDDNIFEIFLPDIGNEYPL